MNGSDAATPPLAEADLKALIERVDVVIGLLARVQPRSERMKVSERIRLLAEFGLDSPTIARIVGKGSNYVSAVLGRKKTKTKKSGRRSRR